MSRPNVFELKAKFKRCLPLSATPSPNRIRSEDSSLDGTPATPTLPYFANGTQFVFNPQMSERNIGALTRFAKTYCANRFLSEAATSDTVEFARVRVCTSYLRVIEFKLSLYCQRTPAEQTIAQFAITAELLETLKGIRDEKALNWDVSKETNVSSSIGIDSYHCY